MALPELPTNWLWTLSAKLLGFWRMLNNGTLLVDVNGDAPNVPDLNAVAPLQAAYNAPEGRFDLSIDPEALTTEVPAGRSIYVDSIAGTPDGTPGDEGDPYDTLVGAIAAATAWLPAADNTIAIILRPGVHPTEPVTLPSWCKLTSTGGRDVTIIMATETDVPVITTSPNSAIEGVTIQGASGSGGAALAHSDGHSELSHSTIVNCETGILATGGVLDVEYSTIARPTPGQVMTTALSIASGAQVFPRNLIIIGTPLSPIELGVKCDGGSYAAAVVQMFHVTSGLWCDNGGFVSWAAGAILYSNIAVYIGPGDANVNLGGVALDGSTWDIKSDGTASDLRSDALLTNGRINLNSGTSWTGTHVVSAPGEQNYNVAAALRVGRYDAPAPTAMGGGDSHTNGMVAYRYDGVSAWTDVTTELRSATGSEVTAFSGTASGNILYVGGDSPFYGLFMIVTLAMAGGAVAVEYYNGSWTALPWMSRNAVSPYTTAGKTIFTATGQRELHFGPVTGWVTTAVNGTTKYWWRVRVTSGLSTIPRLEQVKLQPTHKTISAGGFDLYFGEARRWRQLTLPNAFSAVGATAPNDQDLWFSDIGAIGLDYNSFPASLDRSVGIGIPIPFELDPTHKARLKIKWQPSSAGAGNVIWRAVTAVATAGSVLATSSPGPLGHTIVSVTTAAPGVTGQETVSLLEIDVSTIITSDRPTLLLMIQRQGTADSYGGAAIVRPGGYEVEWLTWADGKPYAA